VLLVFSLLLPTHGRERVSCTMLPSMVEIMTLRGLQSADLNESSILRSEPSSPLFATGDPSGGVSRLFIILPAHFVRRRGRVSCTMLPWMVEIMALGELQIDNLSEAPVPSVGSRHEVRWGPSSYSQVSTHIVVGPVRPGPTGCYLSSR
jgi:hypothetical protein